MNQLDKDQPMVDPSTQLDVNRSSESPMHRLDGTPNWMMLVPHMVAGALVWLTAQVIPDPRWWNAWTWPRGELQATMTALIAVCGICGPLAIVSVCWLCRARMPAYRLPVNVTVDSSKVSENHAA